MRAAGENPGMQTVKEDKSFTTTKKKFNAEYNERNARGKIFATLGSCWQVQNIILYNPVAHLLEIPIGISRLYKMYLFYERIIIRFSIYNNNVP